MTGGRIDDGEDRRPPADPPYAPPAAATAGAATGGATGADPGHRGNAGQGDDEAGSTNDQPPDSAERSGRVTIIEPDSGRSAAAPHADASSGDDRGAPRLPGYSEQAPPVPAEPPPVRRAGTVSSVGAYGSVSERNRRVYRRANPWYRRLARGLIVLCLIGALAVGVYLGAQAVQEYMARDQLPPAAPGIPPIQSTTIVVSSTSAALPLEGTLSLDVTSGAFEFVGTAGSPNATDRLTSPEGEAILILNPNATWSVATGDEAIVATVEQAIAVLAGADTADAILTNRLRNEYVELVGRTESGPASAQITQYDLALDLTGFAESYPLQWTDYQAVAIPGVEASPRHETSISTDDESVLVRVHDEESGWSWERLAYSDEAYVAFRPPATQVINPETQETATGIECQIDALEVGWRTTLPTCEESESAGRELAVSVGLAASADAPVAELAFANVCATMQGEEVRTFDDEAYLQLAGLLVDTGVCPGDTSLLQTAVGG